MRQRAPAPPQSPLARRPGHLALCGLASTLLLAACSSTPLPPWPSSPAPVRKVVRIPPPKAPAPASPQQPERVEPLPVDTLVQVQAIAPPVLPSPVAPDIAQHYPDPATPHQTPGLAPDRRAMTTNAELGQWLQQQRQALRPSIQQARLIELGASQQGTPLQALLLTRASRTDPASLEASGRPTVLLLGQQHGDAPASSEALLVIALELAQGPLASVLDKLHVLVLPRANPDGAERAQGRLINGIDLQADHLLLRSPEAQAIARLMRDYRPMVVIDATEFPVQHSQLLPFGGVPLHDLHWQVAATPHYPEFLSKAAREWFLPPLAKALQAEDLRGTQHHQGSTNPQDRRIDLGSLEPDASHNTLGLHGAISLRIASRGSDLDRQHLQRRVHSLVVATRSLLRSAAERADALQQVRNFVDRDTGAQACRDTLTLSVRRETQPYELQLRHPETGAEQRQQVEAFTPARWQALETRSRPCGYWLDAGAATAVERLRLLDLRVLRIAEAGTVLAESTPPSSSSERRSGPVPRSLLDVPVGSYYLPLNQPGAALAVAALEAGTPYGYLAHGLIAQPGQVARVMAIPELVFDDQEP